MRGVLGRRESRAGCVGVKVVWVGIDLVSFVLRGGLKEGVEVLPAEVKIVMEIVIGVTAMWLALVSLFLLGDWVGYTIFWPEYPRYLSIFLSLEQDA